MVPLDLAFSLDVCQQLIWEKRSQWLLIISEPDIQNVCGVCDRHESFAQAGTYTVRLYHENNFGWKPLRCDWMETVCGCRNEQTDPKASPPEGKMVWMTTFCDACLMHDMVAGENASGIVEFLSQTPINCMSKHQVRVKTATHGLEFMVA